MKKSSFKKFAKITLSILGVIFLSLLVWANWEAKGYTQIHVDDSKFVVYDVSDIKNNPLHINLEKEIGEIDGISSCSYNSAKQFVGVIFYPSKISSLQLQYQIRTNLGINVTETNAPQQKSGCPVGGVKYFILHVKHALNFRS